MLRNYRFSLIHLHWLGLDIVAASVAAHLAASRLADGISGSPLGQSLLVGLGAWGTYLLYYQFDNRRKERPVSPRSTFQETYSTELKKLGAGSLILSALLFWLSPKAVWIFILCFGSCLALFFWLISALPLKKDLRALKEPVTALLYSVGVWGSTWLMEKEISWESKLLGSVFFLTVLQNFLVTAHFEAVRYKGTYNLARWLKRANLMKAVYCIAIVVLLIGSFTIYSTEFRYSQRLSVFIVGMAIAPILLLKNAERILPNDRYEFLIKFILLLPLLAL